MIALIFIIFTVILIISFGGLAAGLAGGMATTAALNSVNKPMNSVNKPMNSVNLPMLTPTIQPCENTTPYVMPRRRKRSRNRAKISFTDNISVRVYDKKTGEILSMGNEAMRK